MDWDLLLSKRLKWAARRSQIWVEDLADGRRRVQISLDAIL